MRTTRRRALILSAASICAATVALTGCTSPTSENANAAAAKVTSLTVMAPYFAAQPPAADNPVGNAIAKEVGAKLDVTWVPNASYGDKTNIVMASNNLPQVMVIQGKDPGFVSNAEAGAFWDLTDYLKDYPNLKTTEPQVQQASSVNGKVYGIFRGRDVMRTAVIVRKDWLKKLGLSMPKTTADLLTVAKAFTEDDPDGDGKNDTYGIAVPKWPGGLGTNSPFDAIETWYGAGNSWYETGGKLEPSFTNSKWEKALKYEKQLKPYLNPDFATLDAGSWNQPFLSGKAGIIIDTYSRARQIDSLLEQQYPDTYQSMTEVTGNLIGPDGTMHALPTAGYSGFLAIPKSSVKTVAELKGVLSVLDKTNSQQGQILMNNGIEGKNFTVKDGKALAIDTPEAKDLTTLVGSYAQLSTGVNGAKYYTPAQPNAFDQKVYDQEQATAAADVKDAVFNPAAAFVSKTYTQQGQTLDNLILDARLKYISGQISLAQVDSAIQQWKANGGSQVITEINALYKKSEK